VAPFLSSALHRGRLPVDMSACRTEGVVVLARARPLHECLAGHVLCRVLVWRPLAPHRKALWSMLRCLRGNPRDLSRVVGGSPHRAKRGGTGCDSVSSNRSGLCRGLYTYFLKASSCCRMNSSNSVMARSASGCHAGLLWFLGRNSRLGGRLRSP
jgi:hypothetical protein